MRELCFEDIMTTRVALPNFIIGCRMSEMRRRLLPSPTPDQQSVRRNLFGPIDHEENFKFVQAELQKIHAVDAEKWNFDFSENKPKEGRFKWEAVGGAEVPSVYQLPHLTTMNNSTTCVVPKFVRNPVTPEKSKPQVPAPTPSSTTTSSSSSSSSAADEIVDRHLADSISLTTTGSTTVITTTTRPSCIPSTAPSGPATQSSSSSNLVVKHNNRTTVESNKKSLDNGKLQQTSIKDMFKCSKKRPLNGQAVSKIESSDDSQPPTLVKRQRTTT